MLHILNLNMTSESNSNSSGNSNIWNSTGLKLSPSFIEVSKSSSKILRCS